MARYEEQTTCTGGLLTLRRFRRNSSLGPAGPNQWSPELHTITVLFSWGGENRCLAEGWWGWGESGLHCNV
jgi:hypothetical protein